MNKVQERCKKEKNAKFFYASQVMATETKIIKLVAFLLSTIPVILSIIPTFSGQKTVVFATTMVSFGLTVIIELISTFLNNHKEKSILLNQLYETSITDVTFSKIEYDREMTNDLNELAIRKAAPKLAKLKDYNVVKVSDKISDRYSYLYICRLNSAKMYYLMSRLYGFYIFALAVVVALFTSFAFIKNNSFEFLQLIIQFYPLVLPIIRNINASSKTKKYCAKVSADIDNYLDGKDNSSERRARFLYYVQNIEFEARMASPAQYVIFYKIFKRGLKTLENGVTRRFIDAMYNLDKRTIKNNKEGTKKDLKEKEPIVKEIKPKEKEIKENKLKKEEKVKDNKIKEQNIKNKKQEKQTKPVDIKQSKPEKTEKKISVKTPFKKKEEKRIEKPLTIKKNTIKKVEENKKVSKTDSKPKTKSSTKEKKKK